MYVIDLQLCPTIRATVRYLPRPGFMDFKITREESEMFGSIQIPAPPSPIGDIVKQHLTVDVNGERMVDTDVDLGLLVSAEFPVADDATIDAVLVYVDDAGNVSAESKASFIAKDTIAPPAPGELGLNLRD